MKVGFAGAVPGGVPAAGVMMAKMTIELEAAMVRQMAHAVVLHYEFLKKMEAGKLPPTEAATLEVARELENRAMIALWKEEKTQ